MTAHPLLPNFAQLIIKKQKMKKLNLLAFVFALLMGVSFTSCLGSGDSEMPYDSLCTVYVNNLYGQYLFEDAAGNTYIPSAESINAIKQNNSGFDLGDYKMAIIYFKWATDETEGGTSTKADTTTPQSYDIDLVMIQKIDYLTATSIPTFENIETMAPGTAPVISLRQSTTWGDIVPEMLDWRTLIAQTGFYTTNDKDKFAEHVLKVVYVQDEITASSENLTIYIQHDKGEDDGYEARYANYYGFDLRQAIATFEGITGKKPAKIIVKAKETIYQSNTLPDKYTEYEVEYKNEN